MAGLTHLELMKVVNRYIGGTGGYLGDFSYRTHADFYPDFCDLDINPNQVRGTTRDRFINILQNAPQADQAKLIRGVVQRFPLGQHQAPRTRTETLRSELLELATQLDGAAVAAPSPRITSAVLKRALSDAETLIRIQGATSGIDRLHTALHGYLIAVCYDAGITCTSEASITTIFHLLRQQHAKLRGSGPREQNITQILRALAAILDAMNPVRNMASAAHPNAELLEEPEATLAINACRTVLQYLDGKLTTI